MLHSTFKGSFLLVEGDIDARLFGRLVNRRACHVQICNNRASAICVVKILDSRHFVGHLGVVDKDYSTLMNETISSENLLLTDENDIELTILCSDTLDRFIAEYGSPEKINAIENSKGLPLREILIRSASTIGTLLLLSKTSGWNLDFKRMTFRFSTRADVDIDLDKQIEHLRGRSPGTTMPSLDVVKAQIETARRQHTALLSHARGCDVCEVLSKGVHDVFGRNRHNLSRGGAAVEEVIRAAYSRENFERTKLYAEIRAWEAKRTPLKVL
jgi:hypothetical protein